jgi:hypothetical protein
MSCLGVIVPTRLPPYSESVVNPLDTKAAPRKRDVIAPLNPASARGEKLSAELKYRPGRDGSILFALASDGQIFSLAGDGQRANIDFVAGWIPLQLAASGRTGELWVLASDGQGGGMAVWLLSRDGWIRVHDCGQTGEARPIIAGAPDGGFWISVTGAIERHRSPEGPRRIAVEIEPTGISIAAEGTVWLLGGSRRYGGHEVRRFDEDADSWFLLPPPAAAISLAGAPDGSAWSVSNKGEPWRLSRDGAGTFRECGMDADCRRCFYKPETSHVRGVAVAPDGNVWFLTGAATQGGFAIERMTDLEARETETPDPASAAVSICAVLATVGSSV